MRTEVFNSSLLLLSFGVFPPLAGAFLGASSMALGLVLSLLLVLAFHVNKLYIFKKIPILLILFVFIILLHSALLHAQFVFFDIRSYLSFILLCFVLSMAFFVSKIILSNNFNIDKSAKYVFWVLLSFAVSALVTNFRLGELVYGHHKSIFPFGEPSHFALFFGPFVFIFIFQLSTILRKLLVVLSVIVLSLLIESTTLLIYSALALLLFVRVSYIGIFLVIPIFIIGFYVILNDPYFISRLVLSADSDNLTALVYFQGLTDAYNALVNTNGIGLGFQMLGTQPPSEVFLKIQAVLGQGLDGGGLNRKDGGFVAAKLVAEFGVLGLILLVAYLTLFIKVFIRLRKLIRLPNTVDPAYVFGLVFIYATFVEIFVRGVGYFSPSLFLFFTAVFIFNFYRIRVKYFAPNYR